MTAFAQISLWGEECVVRLSRRGLRLSPQGQPGRPTQRPQGIKPGEWTQYIRYRRKAVQRNQVPLEYHAWMESTEKFRERGRRGGSAPRERNAQVIEWVTIIHRAELVKNPEIEQAWNKRLFYDPDLAKTHRVHLRGIQKRVVR